MESPPHFNFNKHDNNIYHIQWLEDDTGFVSCGADKRFNFWNLYKKDGKNKDYQPEPKWFYENNKVMFTSTYVYKSETNEHLVYATCSDKCIREIGAPDEK
jgi:WD40 repeat protein